jgi:hypothetical protein
MADNLKFWSVFLVLCAVIIALGWKQPLRYRFMSSQQIYELEHPNAATPVPDRVETPKPSWMRDPARRTKLDQSPSRERGDTNDGRSSAGR